MSNILTIVRKLLAQLVPLLLLLLAQLVAAGSVYALFSWPQWWLPGAVLLFVFTLVSFGFLMAASYSLKHFAPMPPHLEAFCKAFLLLVGYPLDYLLNASVFTVLLLRPPMETTVTERLNRYGKKTGWQGSVARYFGGVWINPLELVNRPHIDIGEGGNG